MKKVVEINNCRECPHFNSRLMLCEYELPTLLISIATIPDWCPLDTPEEYVEKNFNIDE